MHVELSSSGRQCGRQSARDAPGRSRRPADQRVDVERHPTTTGRAASRAGSPTAGLPAEPAEAALQCRKLSSARDRSTVNGRMSPACSSESSGPRGGRSTRRTRTAGSDADAVRDSGSAASQRSTSTAAAGVRRRPSPGRRHHRLHSARSTSSNGSSSGGRSRPLVVTVTADEGRAPGEAAIAPQMEGELVSRTDGVAPQTLRSGR